MPIIMSAGHLNTPERVVVQHVRAAIKRGHPQVRPFVTQDTPIALVAGGPSLLETEATLRTVVADGAKIVAVNGAYQWCLDQGLRPSMAVMLDARPENAHMFQHASPGCRYMVASQCAPETFDAVAGRDVWVFHAVSYPDTEVPILTQYYSPAPFFPVTLGSTVTVRTLSLLRMLGFTRYHIFGMDSCWMAPAGGPLRHHAYPQALNDGDQHIPVRAELDGRVVRTFLCAPWHLKQWEDVQRWIKTRGTMAQFEVYGDGLIAFMMRTTARIVQTEAA